jgi:signal transduction histidine kinase
MHRRRPKNAVDNAGGARALRLDAALRANALLQRRVEALEESMREPQRCVRQDLHDSVGQQLVGISYSVSMLEHDVSPELRPQVAKLAALVRSAMESTRRIARGLPPLPEPCLDAQGLAEQLRRLGDEARMTFGWEVALDVDDVPAESVEARDHLLLIAREAVNNAVRHSGGKQLRIALAVEGTQGVLTVRDDGRGMHAQPASPGLGLRGMQYRARLCDARVDVTDAPDGGVIVRCAWERGRP